MPDPLPPVVVVHRHPDLEALEEQPRAPLQAGGPLALGQPHAQTGGGHATPGRGLGNLRSTYTKLAFNATLKGLFTLINTNVPQCRDGWVDDEWDEEEDD